MSLLHWIAALAFGLGAEEGARFEVLVLGTYHAPAMFTNDRYTPGHIRATLGSARPDVVAVESHPTWFDAGRYHVVTYEAEGVAAPFARERGLPVYGVDWKDVEAWDRMEELNAAREADRVREALADGAPLKAPVFGWTPGPHPSGEEVDWRFINDVDSDEFGRSRHPNKSPDDDDFAAPRDQQIARRCVDVMRDHPGERLVVVIGAHHKPFLDVLFARVPGVRVLKLGVDVPVPGDREVAAAQRPADLLASLAYRLDSPPSYFHPSMVDVEECERMLDALRASGRFPRESRYFAARLDAVAGRTDAAAVGLSTLIEEGIDGDPYPFPMREWRMRYSLLEAARIERARLHLADGADDAAARLLEPVMTSVDFRLRRLEATRPREVRRVDVVKDHGFELGRRADSIFDGWDTYLPSGGGRLAFAGDEEIRHEGARSLRVDVLDANPYGYGFHIRQEVTLPRSIDPDDGFAFTVWMRGDGVDEATVELAPTWSSQTRTPLATRTVELTDRFAPVQVELPPGGPESFAIYIRFDAAEGARLWLDGGTRHVRRYVTTPREWSRLKRAAEFPRSLLAGVSFDASRNATAAARSAAVGSTGGASAVPIVSRRELRDAGFEEGALASSPLAGWYCHGATDGSVRAARDEEVVAHGEASLRLQVARSPAPPMRRHAVSQLIRWGDDGRRGAFSVDARANRAARLLLDVGVYDEPSTFRSLTRREVELGVEWERVAVEWTLPDGMHDVCVFVYLPEDEGVTVWLDGAAIVVGES